MNPLQYSSISSSSRVILGYQLESSLVTISPSSLDKVEYWFSYNLRVSFTAYSGSSSMHKGGFTWSLSFYPST